MNAAAWARRRARVLDAIAAAGGGVAIHATAPFAIRNRDSEYPYRHDSYFHYLTGFTEPDAVVALVATPATRKSVLFCRERDPQHEIWHGYCHGPEAAAQRFGFDEAWPIGAIDDAMPKLIEDAPALWCALDGGTLDASLRRWMAAVRAHERQGARAPSSTHDLLRLLDEMRLVKDDDEIATMRRAAAIGARAHLRAMRAARPGMREYELEAELLHEFRRSGAQAPAYTSIVAAGANACVLHYPAGDAELRAGDLCLIDAGCELDSYACDITRTFPVDGRFTGAQRAVYEIVLAAQAAALAEVQPGRPFNAFHDAATRVLVQGMIDLKLLSGSVDGAIESGAYRQFYMHRTGHWLGLDVHDPGDYRAPSANAPAADGDARPWRAFVPGMVVTVEPGLYIRPAENVPATLEHIGVRIEDDVLVTASGHEVLTADAPKSIADVEAAMRG